MTENDLNLALIGRLLRHRWPILALLAVVGALLGAASSPLISPGYRSSTKVLLKGNSDDAELAEAQIATSLVVLDRTADGLQWGDTGENLRGRVSASVENGDVIQITGTASTPERAQELADRATREYMAFSSQIVNDAVAAYDEVYKQSLQRAQKQIDDTQQRITELQASPQVAAEGPDGIKARDELDRARTTLQQQNADLDKLEEKQQASKQDSLAQGSARVIEPAVLPSGAASPTMVELIACGALVFTLFGVLAHLGALRSDRRLRTGSEIAASAGAPVIGTVEVAAQQAPRRISWHDDRRWAAPNDRVVDDERGRASRYHRILSRLPTRDGRLRVLVLVPMDDPNARTMVLDLAVVAAAAGRIVSVDVEDAPLSEAVRRAADRSGVSGTLTVGAGAPDTHTLIAVRAVAAHRPLVPPAEARTATLLAVTVGTRTPFELAEIATASAEAGRPLVGVVVVTTGVVAHVALPGRRANAMAVAR